MPGEHETGLGPALIRDRGHGLRLSVGDAVFLAAGFAAGPLLSPVFGDPAWLAAVVVSHFFLFCNVFRVGTRRELAWTAWFLANALWWILQGDPSPLRILVTQLPATLAVIVHVVRSPGYHGIFCSLPAAPPPPHDARERL